MSLNIPSPSSSHEEPFTRSTQGGETQADAFKGGGPSRASLSAPNPIRSRIVLHPRGCPSRWLAPCRETLRRCTPKGLSVSFHNACHRPTFQGGGEVDHRTRPRHAREAEQWLFDQDSEKENRRHTGLSIISEIPAYTEEMQEEISSVKDAEVEEGDDEEGCGAFQGVLGPGSQTAAASMAPRRASTQSFRWTPVLPPLTLYLVGAPGHFRMLSTALENISHHSRPPTTDDLVPRFYTPRRTSARCLPTQKFTCTLTRRRRPQAWPHPMSPHSVVECLRPRFCVRYHHLEFHCVCHEWEFPPCVADAVTQGS
jgi:hypothetical protein